MDSSSQQKDLKHLPLSNNQQRLWILSQQNSSDPSYNINMVYHLEGEINIGILNKSIELIFERQFTLFSVFNQSNGIPYISIIPKHVAIELKDFSGQSVQSAREEILSFAGEQSRIPFDLENGPLYRIYLLKETEQSWFFCMTIHHIIFDGFSRRLFVQELSRIYSNLIFGIDEVNAPLKLHSFDFAALEKQALPSENEKETIEYWKKNLKDCPPDIKFPYDFPIRSKPSGLGCKETFYLSGELSEKLRSISIESDTTVFKTLLSILGILFVRYTGINDICIGIPVSNRRTSDSFKIFGFIVDTLPIRLIIDTESDFRKHIRKSDDTINKALHYTMPFDRIVAALNPERVHGLSPFFQISFSWINNFTNPLDLGGIAGKRITVENGVASSDITFYMWENGDIIEGEIEYNTDILKRDTIIRLRDNFLILVKNLIEYKDTAIGSIPMISEDESILIDSVNNSRTDYPKDSTIVQLFEEQVDQYPDKTAIVFKNSSLTYSQLNQKSNQLARVLRNSGVRANDPVAILVDKSVDMIIGIFGILKAGGAYVPLDPEYPEQRKNFVLSDSECRIIITQDIYLNEIFEGITKFSLDSSDSYHIDGSNIEGINSSSDLAYIIYTSGTTGMPKGTLIQHKGVVRLVRNTNYIDFTSEDRILQAASIVFDASTEEIFGALLNGATLYIVDKETLLDPDALGDVLIKNNISIADIASALFTQIAEIRTDIFQKLKILILGGEVVSAPHINKVRKSNSQLTVINSYGPTENACNSTAYKIDRDFDSNIPIGKPISNSRAYIFDKYMNYQPVGIIGELYVGGDGVSPGYLKRDDLNRSSFIQHPFIPEERLYKTGDYARWLPDGNIEFHGRMDNQLKIRGFRVELGEIESQISQIDGIIDVVVKPLYIEDKDIKLIAFLNVPEDFKTDSREILELLKSKLPSYMIPYGIKLMHGFPLTINGKTDKRALIYEEEGSDDTSRKQETLSTPTEEKLYKIWSEMLRTKEIGINVSFFEAGGNSLLVISLINKLENELGVSISYRDLIINSSIADLGKYIDENSTETESSSNLVHLTDLNSLPLTQSQARIWLITLMNPSIPNYIIPFAYRLDGPLKIDIFRRSIDALFSRHHVLFSRILERDGDPYCVIDKTEVHIEFIDYSDIRSKEGESRIFELINEDSRRVFDLTNGPLYRLYLFKLSDNEFCFYCAIHHIVFDGWSWKVFINDLNQIYSDLKAETKISLKELVFQQYDFAHWEKQTGLLKDETKLIKYWKSQLEGCSTQLNFPYDFPRMHNSTGFGKKERIEFPSGISKALRQISKNEGVSLFATMMSAFGILMHKYSGDSDLNIGTPVANRSHFSFENVVGMFVNTLVIRFQLDQEISFKNLIRRTNELILDAISYQDLQFEKIVEIVNPKRFSNANPVFQVAFGWEDNLSVPLNLDGIKGEQLNIRDVTSPFDITCSLYNNGDRIEGALSYNTDLIRKDTAVRLCDNFVNLVSNLAINNEVPVASVPMITDNEKQKILSFTETTTPYSEDKTIVQLFEERVALNSEITAIVFDKGKMTYFELNEKATQLAGVLQDYGIGPGDFIGLLLSRSPELIICLLAILKTGAAYVPLNPADPEKRIISNIISSKIKYLIINTGHTLKLDGICEHLNIEQLNCRTCDFPDSFKPVMLISTDPAYIIFTSGTTGIPKGVLVNHKSVINLIEWVNSTFKISPNDKLLWVTNLNFDLSVYDIFGILAAGGSIRIVNDEDRQDPKKLYYILLNEGITFWDSAPQNLQQLTSFFNQRQDPGLYNSLRLVFLSGDWIPLSLPPIISSNFPSALVVGLGGATEATIWSNYFIINKINPEWKSIPYGKPIQNARYYILDDKMNHCRIQQPGNLYIGGDCLAMGYYNDPALTDSKFIPDPFNSGLKLYITGDKAQWKADGNIEFLGREDEQLKIRGYRVEMGEIQNVALKNKAIKEAIVIPDKSDRHNMKALLFITAFDDRKIEVQDLKREFREHLPEYMIPADIIQYKEFPLTLNGKIDTKTLFSDYAESLIGKGVSRTRGKTGDVVEILTPSEEIIHKIWCDILKTTNISKKENFLDLGGNSLLAISLINKLESELGVSISFRDLTVYSSITELGKYVEENSSVPGSSPLLVHLTDLTNLPLTQSQTRIWLITQLNPSLPNYIVPFAYRLNGPLNIDIFRSSIDALFSRHHVLFSRISEREGVPYCIIEKTKVHIEYIDYSGIGSKEGESRIFELINEDSRRVFDLTNGPLYRLYLFKLSDNEFCFYCAFHHIVFDGWSWKIFIDDLNQIYKDLEAGREISLKELPFQQYDFAHWEKLKGLSKVETKLVEYWKNQLKGCSSLLNFPLDFPRLINPTGFAEIERIKFPAGISSALRQISKNEGVSLFATMMSAFGILMHKYSGDNDLNIGTPVANRSHSSFENVIGMFVNTLVIRMQLDQEASFNNLIRKTNETILDAITWQDLQFEKIVEIVNPERFTNANPVFQVIFAWEDNLGVPLNPGDIKGEQLFIQGGTSLSFDLSCTLHNNGDCIEGALIYNSDLIRKDTVKRICDNFQSLVSNLVSNNEDPVTNVPMITEQEKNKVLKFTETKTPYPKDKTIARLFEEQVSLYPDKKAVVFKDNSLTYNQLNSKSNQLARVLRNSGVRANDPVAILVDRSVEMIVGILGILKAGGAYVPLDPEYPEQRKNFIIKNAGCRILITQDKYISDTEEGIVIISLDSSDSYHTDKSNVEVINVSSDLAYIIYTSGTTGIPKGTLIPQHGVVRLVRNTNYIEFTLEDRVLQTSSIVFDASTLDIFGALLNGATLYIADKGITLDTNELGKMLAETKITIAVMSSALFTHIAESDSDIFNKLKILIIGGDVLSAPHVNRVRKNNPQLAVINAYGPTENSCNSTTFKIDRDFEYNIPIGKPISNSTAYIFDKNMNYQPIGIIGELYVGGDGLSVGYLKRDDLNKNSFIQHPYIPGERLYKTGDYARWLPDGNIEFHGRIDNQIKIRGFRIEIEEIEAVLSEIDGIKEAVVKPVIIDANDIRLVAFLDVKDDFDIDLNEVNKTIIKKLPSYMLPYTYKTVQGFPLTVNGKIDKKALTIDLSAINENKTSELKELTITQKKVLKIWQDIIKTKSLGINDNFFDVGGTSLLAVKVVDRIEKEFNIRFVLRNFFNYPVIQNIAEHIDILTNPINIPEKNESMQKPDAENIIIKGEL